MTATVDAERRGRPLAGPAARERMLAGIAVSERRLDVGGVTTAVLEAGAGPPLLLMHGGIECGGAMWAPVISRLADSHRVIAPDAPGLGESAPLPKLDADAFSAWLAELVRLTCDDKPALVCHSLFGSYGARFAVRHGDLLRRLVVYAAPGVAPYRMPLRLRMVATRFMLRPTQRNAERFDRFALLDLDATRDRDPQWFDAFAAYTPTALLWGRDDRMVPLGVGEAASARLGWPLHVVDGAAHAPHIEQPGDFLRALDEALGL